ncbi:MAG: alpha/beta hydrolase [Ruminococcus sp.]|nr:alpha/beta hydrolase [Ruminococcus sp.]
MNYKNIEPEFMVSEYIINGGTDCRVPGLCISIAVHRPKGEPCGIVQFIHGMSEHKERYFPFMDHLVEKGYICIISDNRGHGKSVVSPEDLGYMYDEPEYFMPHDQEWIYTFADRLFPDLPHFIIAHSLGSLIARCMLNRRKITPDGVFLLGTPCYNKLSAAVDMLGSDFLNKFGERYRSTAVSSFSENFFNRRFGDVPHSWISSDPETVRHFTEDPLCGFTYTLKGYAGVLSIMKRAYTPAPDDVRTPTSIPVHLISGKDDPCMFSEEKFFNSVAALENMGYMNVTHRLYPGMRHEVLNEMDKMTVWNDIAEKLALWSSSVDISSRRSERI